MLLARGPGLPACVAVHLLNDALGTDVALVISADLTVGGFLRHDDSWVM
jgi:hypothetical protein